VCRGAGITRDAAGEVKGHSIADLLDATVEEALPLMRTCRQIRAKLQTLYDVGLGYVHLGPSSTTLSGGEAQRIKLAKETEQTAAGRTFYLLTSPPRGCTSTTCASSDVLQAWWDGHTVVVIEHTWT